jgi:uncharacterized protein (TIGR02266 family)
MAVKVLIVDDMKSFLDLETSFLKRTDCTVLKALNGLEALRMAKDEKPDIVFLDLEMPVMNGVECCRFIKSDAEIKHIPIVIVTASEKEEECYKAGCNSYLRKPIDEGIFLTEIQKFVSIVVRKDPRVDIELPVSVSYKGTKTPGTALNLSRGGLLLETKEPFAVGSKVTVDFSLPDVKQKIKLKAMVVRTGKGRAPEYSSLGISFVDIGDKHQSSIDSFIEGK